MSATRDIVVVGNGVVGLATATALVEAAPDAKVMVIGPSHRRGGASAAAGAMLSCFGEVTRHSLSSPAGCARFELQRASHEQWPNELSELAQFCGSDEPLTVAEDTYVFLNSRGGALDTLNLDAMVAALRHWAEPFEWVDAVPGLDPTPDARPLRALRLPREGAVHSLRLLRAMEKRAASQKVELVDAEVDQLSRSRGTVTGVRLNNGETIPAGMVVVAAGAFSSPLLAGLGPAAVLPVFSGSGMALVAQRVMGAGLSSVVRSVTRSGSCGLHGIPLGDGLEYFGATNVIFAQPELRPHLGICQFLTQCVIDQIDRAASYSRIDAIRMGNRPVPLDTFPLLGPGPAPGLWVLTGGYRDGLHAAPEVARLAAASISSGDNRFPSLFSPCRLPISTMSIEESITDFVDQQVASAFEGGLHLTPFLFTGDLAASFRPRAERLYERLGTDLGLAPDIVNFLCLSRKTEDDVDQAAKYLSAVGGR